MLILKMGSLNHICLKLARNCTFHFFIDFTAPAFGYLILYTDRYHIIQSWTTCSIYG